ncbi:MAG: putative peptide zinc metalloprotease protein [Actinomycetota bacterium]|nr:putative peptide zinc metalloprotease protein [Actinomycetota bacterium]
MIQLTRLLYLVAEHADGERDYDAIASLVSEQFDKTVSADNVRTLVDDKLRPLGLLAAADGSSPPVTKPDPLLALRFRKAVIPESASTKVASLFKPLFFPPVVLGALVGLVLFDVWLFLHHGVAQGFHEALYHPSLLVLVLAFVIVGAGWHEFGHAAGCAYGGACPGAMGCGIYLVYPAFYTDVTDSYRLNRRGRLRTDLAGVYFNALFILAVAGLYAVTHFEALLLVIVVQHIEVAHQLLPFLRLDGYYIVADLTGVPDMFSRIRPILVSMIPFRKPDPKVTVLRPWVRLVVTVWVLAVIPLLLFQLGMLLLHAPRIFATAWDSLGQQREAISTAFGNGNVLGGLGGIGQSLILVLPLAGIVLTLARVGSRVATKTWKATEGRPVSRLAAGVATCVLVGGLVYTWLPNGDYEPIRQGERGTLGEGLRAVAHVPSGGPSLESEEVAAEEGRLEDPTVSTTVPEDTTDTTAVKKATTTVAPDVIPPPVAPVANGSPTTTVAN